LWNGSKNLLSKLHKREDEILEEIKEHYFLENPEEIEFFLASHPATRPKLPEVADYIKKYFPQAELTLKLIEGEDSDWFGGEGNPKVLVFIHLGMKPNNEIMSFYLLLYKSLVELYSEYELVFFGEITPNERSKIDVEKWRNAQIKIIGEEDENMIEH
jgi:hypothetical protein